MHCLHIFKGVVTLGWESFLLFCPKGRTFLIRDFILKTLIRASVLLPIDVGHIRLHLITVEELMVFGLETSKEPLELLAWVRFPLKLCGK